MLNINKIYTLQLKQTRDGYKTDFTKLIFPDLISKCRLNFTC
jgi:hypothetical protein